VLARRGQTPGADGVRVLLSEGSPSSSPPVLRDPPSAAPLALVAARALASPRQATEMAGKAVARYSLAASTIDVVRAADG
jgi:hypothetical protein